jgi:hypothetical protein
MIYLRFKPGVIPTQVDHDRVVLHVGSTPLVELSNLSIDEVRFILSLIPLSVYGSLLGKVSANPSIHVRRDIILLVKKMRLVEEYQSRHPGFFYLASNKNQATYICKNLKVSHRRGYSMRRSKNIALIGLEKFNSLLILQLLDHGFRRFIISRSFITSSDLGPVHERETFGRTNLESYMNRFQWLYPDVVFTYECKTLPDFLVVSYNHLPEELSAFPFYQAGIPNMVVRIEPLRSNISPIFQKDSTGCYDCYFQQIPESVRKLIRNQAAMNASEIYDYESADLVHVTSALASNQIAKFFSRNWDDRDQVEWDITHDTQINSKKFVDNGFRCNFCRDEMSLPNPVLPAIRAFSSKAEKVMHI